MAGRSRYQTKQAVSAGGVVYRRAADGFEVLLLETPGGKWGLPKGTPSEGETIQQTALREVREETGLEVELEEELDAIEYWFVRSAERTRFHKQVHFWLMRPVGGSIEQHDHEHVSVRWFPLPEALRRVAFANAAETLQRAATLLAKRPRRGAEDRHDDHAG